MNDQVLKWLTFALMLMIQIVAATAILSKVNYIASEHAREIQRLRDWRHEFGARQGVYDDYHERITENAARLEQLDGRLGRVDERVGALERRRNAS